MFRLLTILNLYVVNGDPDDLHSLLQYRENLFHNFGVDDIIVAFGVAGGRRRGSGIRLGLCALRLLLGVNGFTEFHCQFFKFLHAGFESGCLQ